MRTLVCACGARLTAEDAAQLLLVARQHADEQHGGDPLYSDQQLEADIERAAHEEERVRASDDELDVIFKGGPRDGETDVVGDRIVVIGTGAEGGVYQRTDEQRDAWTVYRWQELTDAEAAALVGADVRASQQDSER